MAEILTAVDAVEIIIEVWNKIKERIEDQEVAEAADVEIAQKVVRDLSAPAARKKDLEIQCRRVYQLLQDIPPAIENVVKNQNRGVPFKYFHPQANKRRAKIVENYRTSFRDFDQAVIRADAATRSDSYLLIQPSDMKVVGYPPEVVQISDGISAARVSYIPPGAKWSSVADVLWETMESSESTWAANDRDMRVLAAALSGALPHWHIPRLKGYERNTSPRTMRLVFEHPDPTRALRTLRDMYDAAPAAPSLTLRVRLCYQLALGVLHAHKPRIGVVHKHIRPDKLLLAVPKTWETETGKLAVPPDWRGDVDGKTGRAGSPNVVDLFLSGWQNARTSAQATPHVGESAPHRVIYQHPQRHQAGKVEKYNIGHDIYSLGVCMLELLTWEPLISYDEDMGCLRLSDAYRTAFCKKGFDADIDIAEDGEENVAMMFTDDADEIKETLLEVAKTFVAPHAGDRLANLVCRCLTCLDAVPMYGGSRFHEGDDKNHVSETFSQEIFADLNKLLDALEHVEVASAAEGASARQLAVGGLRLWPVPVHTRPVTDVGSP
ncbi:hypothetical protein C8A01DRAFT_36317 [Parachaetomium inaequale]|uniref:Protein kinase domain-containing protein n=1 Tax=Parachaetomium inaequale TaxID=2588326 RepID=A0AAN6PEY2_9PEZI|nr:hypothetical protein C8A01DRAFT_36317 [Parachaetomium inaequale]